MISPFKSWCVSQGIVTPLETHGDLPYRFMKYNDKENGRDVIDGQILKVPLSACLISDTPTSLAAKLGKERDLGEDSKFAPYINILPPLDHYRNILPRFWNDEKLDLLTKGDGGQALQKMDQDACPGLDQWALACVNSRANYLQGRGYAMTPILDMINHDNTSITRGAILEDELILSIEKGFNIGTEVFISYGDLTNLETMCNYGFCQKSNPCNIELVDVRMIQKPSITLSISHDGSIDVGSIAILRSYLATPEDINAKEKKLGIYLHESSLFASPLSESNEEDVFSFIASFLDEAIYDASTGAAIAQKRNYEVIAIYLTERAVTLERSISSLQQRYPFLDL